MAGKPIKVSTFYSRKKADVFPIESNLSEDSDCESDDGEVSRRTDLVIQESSHEDKSEDESSRPKTKALPVRRKKRITSVVVSDRYNSNNGSVKESKSRKPQSSRKLIFPSPEPKQVQDQAKIDVDNLSSPDISPISSVLQSPVHSDDELWDKIKSRVPSPDMFAEFDPTTPLHSTLIDLTSRHQDTSGTSDILIPDSKDVSEPISKTSVIKPMPSHSTPKAQNPDLSRMCSQDKSERSDDILISQLKHKPNLTQKTSVLKPIENIVNGKEEKLKSDSVSATRMKRLTRKTTSHNKESKSIFTGDENVDNVLCSDLVSNTPIVLPVCGKKRVSISKIPPSTKGNEPKSKRRKSTPNVHIQGPTSTSEQEVDKIVEPEEHLESNLSTSPQPLREKKHNKPTEKSSTSGKKNSSSKQTGSTSNENLRANVQLDKQSDADVPQPTTLLSKDHPVKNRTATKKKAASKTKTITYLTSDDDEEEIERWREGDLEETRRQPSVVSLPDDVKRPIEYFNYYFDEEILSLIVEETNNYSLQKDGKPLSLSIEELKVWLGIWLYMGLCSLPSLKDYWSTEFRVNQIADCMPVKRFQKIRSHLHLSDNLDDSEEAAADRFRKVRPLITHMQIKCRALDQEGNLSIDEIIIPYKGKFSSLKQYNPMKPIKYGFKFYGLADSSGILYDFLPSCGSTTFDQSNLTEEENVKNVTSKSVIAMCKQIRHPEGTVVYFDNWFSSVSLMSYLHSTMNILSVGTIRKDRTEHCPFTSDKEFSKRPRGSVESFVSSDAVVAVHWLDSKPICLASTAAGVEPQTTVKRFEKAAQRRVDVVCPRIIQLYNTYMGGVDLSDQYIAAHRVPTRSKRWYFPIIGYLLDLAVVNSYLQYCRDNKLLEVGSKEVQFENAKEFRLSLSKSLRCLETQGQDRSLDQSFPKKKHIKSPLYRPCDEVRFDGTKHWPIFSETVLRCKHCTAGKTTMMCSKCKLSLCCKSNRNCFVDFHKKKR